MNGFRIPVGAMLSICDSCSMIRRGMSKGHVQLEGKLAFRPAVCYTLGQCPTIFTQSVQSQSPWIDRDPPFSAGLEIGA